MKTWLKCGLIALAIDFALWLVWVLWGALNVFYGSGDNELIVLGILVVLVVGLLSFVVAFGIGALIGYLIDKPRGRKK